MIQKASEDTHKFGLFDALLVFLTILLIVFLFSQLYPKDCYADWKSVPNVCKREYNSSMVGLKYTRKCGGMPWGVVCYNGTYFEAIDWIDSNDYKGLEELSKGK